jgi:hypothetical protein
MLDKYGRNYSYYKNNGINSWNTAKTIPHEHILLSTCQLIFRYQNFFKYEQWKYWSCNYKITSSDMTDLHNLAVMTKNITQILLKNEGSTSTTSIYLHYIIIVNYNPLYSLTDSHTHSHTHTHWVNYISLGNYQ